MPPSAHPVQLGVWTNWSHGKVMGSTLTLTRDDANLLIALLAFFVTIIAGHLWAITCYAIHAYNSSRNPPLGDRLHLQRQVIVRNSPGPMATFITATQLAITWRRVSGNSAYWKFLPLLVCGLVHAVGSTLASGFSSRVTLGTEIEGSEALLSTFGGGCGILSREAPGAQNAKDVLNIMAPSNSESLFNAATFASQCYPFNGTSPKCSTFIRSRLPVSVDQNGPCPFGDGICRSSDMNLKLDSGLIDSHEDLGVNAPKSQRWKYRRVVQCAPLRTDGYEKRRQNTTNGIQETSYFYGEQDVPTYKYMKREAPAGGMYAQPDYVIGIENAWYTSGNLSQSSSFSPMESLQVKNADISIFFMSTDGIKFVEKCLDPWYQATQPAPNDTTIAIGNDQEETDNTLFTSDEPAAPLACTYQEQFCNPVTKACTPLASSHDSRSRLPAIFSGDDDDDDDPSSSLQRAVWLDRVVTGFGNLPHEILAMLGPQALRSRKLLLMNRQGALPDNQWQLDMRFLFETGLANIQQSTVNTPGGHINVPLPITPGHDHDHDDAGDEGKEEGGKGGGKGKKQRDVLLRPGNEVEERLCRSQKIRTTDYTSFSVVGLSTIFVVGLLIIALNLSLHGIVMRLAIYQKGKRRNEEESDETTVVMRTCRGLGYWEMDGVLQLLQRLAYEKGMVEEKGGLGDGGTRGKKIDVKMNGNGDDDDGMEKGRVEIKVRESFDGWS